MHAVIKLYCTDVSCEWVSCLQMGKQHGQESATLDPSSAGPRRDNIPYPRRYRGAFATGHEWPDTESVDVEIDVNSGDLQGSERSELEVLSPGTHTGKGGNGIVGGS